MAQFQRNPQTAWRRVENEVVIVATRGNKLTVLNDTAARVWELLDGGASSADIGEAIAREYEVEARVASADVDRLLADLLERQLVAKVEA
jgi:hypothetical protein